MSETATQGIQQGRKGLGRWTKVWLKIGLCVVLGISAYVYWANFEYRFVVVEEGAAYHSSRIPPEKIGDFAHKHGVRTVIDLRFAGAATEAERKACEAAGIRYVSIPSEQVPDDDAVARFLEIARDPANRPLLMHCFHGEGRAPLFGAIYRIEIEGWSPEEARKATRPFPFLGNFRKGAAKGKYLRDYKPRLRPSADPSKPEN